jgi:hypothetical protein|tara:strand:+ start:393 stop:686 length:294 start_codon:yes stop_codon:yes gene_type:complete
MNRVKIIFPNDDPRWNYVRGAFPKTKAEARECWEHIVCGLAPESITEDGELSTREARRKERGILQDAKLLFTRFKCPKDVAEYCDVDLSKFVEVQND